jgi:putative endopeptidase
MFKSTLLAGIAICVAGTGLSMAAAPATGLDLAGIDRSVVPGNDFFRYANGSWLAATQIPADRSSYGTGAMLVELTTKRTVELLRQAADSKAPAGSETRKIGDYYTSFMGEAEIEKRGLQPLQPALKEIASIGDRHRLAEVLGKTLRADVDVLNNTQFHTSNLFGLWVAQDLDTPSRYSPFLLQGGLGMPDRDYYLKSSPDMAENRAKYQKHIAAVLKLAQVPDAEAKAARIFDLEHRMAEVHWSRALSEEVLKGNNHWARADFQRRAPGLDWEAYFAAAGLAHQPTFVVWQPSALIGLAALTASQPLETWKDYLTFRRIEHASRYLPKAFVDEEFAFYGTVLSGTPELQPRWKRAVEDTDRALGEAVGKIYVQRYFPPPDKARAEAMVRNLLTAFGHRIDKLDWMAPQTKAKAKAKLAALKIGVGYPDRWRDYSGLVIVRGDALGNAERAELFEYHRNLAKLKQPVDRSEWAMTPQTVNAVNLPAMNAINFPAAILQPPNFDPNREAVMDYGAIGAVIGHEISHSFDDQGALFDDSGRLRNWWTPEDFAHFQAAAARLVTQFDGYHPFADLAVNGKQTLSENIADVAGLAAAYDASQLALEGKQAEPVSGFNGDQLFFLSFGQTWRTKVREPALRRQVVTDGHAPAEYRADTVRNLDAWYGAFNVQPGQKLYLAPQERVRIW